MSSLLQEVASKAHNLSPSERAELAHELIVSLDDVKDNYADRRKGLDYMLAPFQRMDLPGWRKRLEERLKEYAAANNVPVTGLAEVRLEELRAEVQATIAEQGAFRVATIGFNLPFDTPAAMMLHPSSGRARRPF